MASNPTIPVLHKAVRVLTALAQGRSFASMTQMAKELGIAPTTCYRILKTFAAADWVRATDSGYELALGLLPIVDGLADVRRVNEALEPAMHDLVRRTGLNVKVSVRRGDEAVTIARLEGDRGMGVAGRIGSRFPLTIGSSGAVLSFELPPAEIDRLIAVAPTGSWRYQPLADYHRRMQDCRKRGWCIDHGSYRPQAWSLSAPLRDRAGRPLAAITLMGFPDDFQHKAARQHAKEITAAILAAQARFNAQVPHGR